MRLRENKNKLMRNAYDAIKISNEIEKYLKINHTYCNKLNAKLIRQLQYQIGVNDDILRELHYDQRKSIRENNKTKDFKNFNERKKKSKNKKIQKIKKISLKTQNRLLMTMLFLTKHE